MVKETVRLPIVRRPVNWFGIKLTALLFFQANTNFPHYKLRRIFGKASEKLFEEMNEFLQSPKLEELGDIIDVADAIIAYRKIDVKQLKKVRDKKIKRLGLFDKRIVLDGLE
jgi:predicted house-cleaning noncanonical NTP pyrophosphatase (MazG superfamily)